MNTAVDAQLVLTAATLAVLLGLWWYVVRHTARVDQLDRRVSLLEERVSGMPALRATLDAMSNQVAALRERVDTSHQLIRSIQEYLMESRR